MKVFGIGLNKTGTKTLGHYLKQLGFNHRSYDSPNVTESASFTLWDAGRLEELLAIMNEYDSCEDWPWPMVYRELDEKFPDAKFILTLRKSPDVWYRSLCNMAIRIGPLPLFEKRVYGSAMPHGHKDRHIQIYCAHNDAVERYFGDRPDKLLKLCWDDGFSPEDLARFVGRQHIQLEAVHINRSPNRVYSGDNLIRAHLSRIIYQWINGPKAPVRSVARRLRNLFIRRKPGNSS